MFFLVGGVRLGHFSLGAALSQALISPESYQQSSPAWFLMPVKGQILISSDRKPVQRESERREREKKSRCLLSELIDTTQDEAQERIFCRPREQRGRRVCIVEIGD